MKEKLYNALRAINHEGLDCGDWGITEYIEGLGTSELFCTVHDIPLIGRYLYCYVNFSRSNYTRIVNSSPRYCLSIKDQPTWQLLIWEVEVVS